MGVFRFSADAHEGHFATPAAQVRTKVDSSCHGVAL